MELGTFQTIARDALGRARNVLFVCGLPRVSHDYVFTRG
jgi:hypothetical protein